MFINLEDLTLIFERKCFNLYKILVCIKMFKFLKHLLIRQGTVTFPFGIRVSKNFFNKHPYVPLGRWKLKKNRTIKYYDYCFRS